MARMVQGLVLVMALATLLDVTFAVEHVVGGGVQKWTFLHANDAFTLYNDWAANQTFKTGDTLLFEYDNATHSVLQVVQADYNTCNLRTPIDKWMTGSDSVFLSNAGTFYFVCGTPFHCEQGMKVAITATGATVAAPPPPPAAIAPSPTSPSHSHAAPGVTFSFTLSVLLTTSLAALVWS
ncbi:hypothetical protein M758_4G041100 [Ceratodon purpureus]|nr:hypothetical protein M758_4G041100 [Ceratodon purpureus]